MNVRKSSRIKTFSFRKIQPSHPSWVGPGKQAWLGKPVLPKVEKGREGTCWVTPLQAPPVPPRGRSRIRKQAIPHCVLAERLPLPLALALFLVPGCRDEGRSFSPSDTSRQAVTGPLHLAGTSSHPGSPPPGPRRRSREVCEVSPAQSSSEPMGAGFLRLGSGSPQVTFPRWPGPCHGVCTFFAGPLFPQPGQDERTHLLL